MLDTYFKQYFWTFQLAAMAAGAYLVARTTNAFVEKKLLPPAEKLVSQERARRPGPRRRQETTPKISLTAFLDRNVFKAKREDLTPPPPTTTEASAERSVYDPEDCEKSSLGARLLATIVSTKNSESMAVFEDKSKQETVACHIGDPLLDDAEVVTIEWRNVRVERNGKCEMFSLEDKASLARSSLPPPPPSRASKKNTFGAGVNKVSENEYTIPREEIDNILSNLNSIATSARIVPSFQNGQANGFKLFSIRPGSLYTKIGIKNGDVIQRINGFEINSPDKALEIYTKLKNAPNITVDLVRRGKSKSLSYSIR